MKLDQLLEHHVNAIGGYAAVEGVNSIQIEFHLVEPEFAVDGIYAATRDGRMRVDIFADNVRVFSEGYDGARGWQLPQDAEHGSPTSPAGTRALQHGIENQLFGLHELSVRGHRLELVGLETIDNSEFYVIKVAFADGHTLWRYVNAANWLIERSRERKALHPDVDPTETTIETRFSDFREVGDDLLRAFYEMQVDLSTEQTLQTTAVRQMTINPAFAPDFFECPL